MNHALPTVASFWFGSDLSWLEALCIQSFLDRGHRFVLFVPKKIANIPICTTVKPASDVLWPAPFDIEDNDRLKVAVFSDIFRLHLFEKTDFIWVDLDAYCVRPFDFETPYVFAHSGVGGFPNGVVRLPKDSETLKLMLEFVTDPNPTQPWRGDRLRRINRRRVSNGESWGIETLPWGCSGPKAFGHFLRQTGEDRHAMPADAFYPLLPDHLWKLHAPEIETADIEREGVYSVHIYGHQKKYLARAAQGLPKPGSYLARLCDRHGIDPTENPIPLLDWMKSGQPTG